MFDPQIIGIEQIITRAGTFETVHISDSTDRGDKTDYWISPDVPGQILKIEYTGADGQSSFYSEIIMVWDDRIPLIKEEEIVDALIFNSGETYSEGAIEEPVFLFPGDEYYGSVEEGGTSYYMFYVDGKSSVNIEVNGLQGLAEILFYNEDFTYEEWISSAEGDYLNIEYDDAPEGTYLYFSINDVIDQWSEGESYYINIYQKYK